MFFMRQAVWCCATFCWLCVAGATALAPLMEYWVSRLRKKHSPRLSSSMHLAYQRVFKRRYKLDATRRYWWESSSDDTFPPLEWTYAKKDRRKKRFPPVVNRPPKCNFLCDHLISVRAAVIWVLFREMSRYRKTVDPLFSHEMPNITFGS